MYLQTFDLYSADAPRNNIDAAIKQFDSEARYIVTTSWLITTSVDINIF
ncbi:hypothetical protein HSX37_16500|nr:hypothetical protein [Dendrosporobacter quercicolus]NSL49637.1 hypothetical protein [Dendrosporobacter quercicolus DSM 1736]